MQTQKKNNKFVSNIDDPEIFDDRYYDDDLDTDRKLMESHLR